MATKWGKRNGCKFASDAVMRGDWLALYGLLMQGGINADCPYPSRETTKFNIITWARRYNSTHPNRDLIKHDMKVEFTYGTPLLHQVVMTEGITNKASHRPGLKVLLDNGADINLQDKANGYTALHVACMLCRTTLIDFLISKNADRSIESHDGEIATDLMPRWCKTVVKAPEYYNPKYDATPVKVDDFEDDDDDM